ncbi:MAG: AAA family ATPase [Gemmatimonadaceae bacterium]
MTLREVEITGFRSLRSVRWLPGPLNMLIGPNGSGKSNLLRGLITLRASALGELPSMVLSQGGIGPLLWDGKAPELGWKIKLDGIANLRDALTYELHLVRIGQSSSYRVSRELLGNYRKVEQGIEEQPFKFLERGSGHAVIFDSENRRLQATQESIPEDQTLLALSASPFTNDVLRQFRDILASWKIYHDMHVDSLAAVRRATVARRESTLSADGQNLVVVLHTLYTSDRDFKETLDQAMAAAFGTDYEELVFPPAADQEIQLRIRWKSLRTEQSAADLSDGTLRFLMLIAALATPQAGALIAIDEPETGLHPSMLPIVAELAAEASVKAQVVITTHSPDLLDAFTQYAPTTTVLQWESGSTSVRTLEGDKLKAWIAEYRLGALFRSGELEVIG